MDYLLEVGTEEIPSRFVDALLDGLNKQFITRLAEARITSDAVETLGTYRRLAVLVKNISDHQSTSTLEIKGPPVKVALDASGNYTPAGLGFLKKNNESSGTVKDGYLTVSIEQKANPTKTVLGDIALQALSSLFLPIAMHWGTEPTVFVRPVHWIVSLLGKDVLPLSFAGQHAGHTTYGHRFLTKSDTLDGQPLTLLNPADYVTTLEKASVLVNPATRRQSIIDQVQEKYPDLVIDPELLSELVHLVEYPTILEGHFDGEYLVIPEKILIITMKKHQKYIPVLKKDALTNTFLVAADNVTKTNTKTIIAGNERVVRARLQDARFYFDDDISKMADHFLEKLKTITYQQELGSISDKVVRNLALALYIADLAELPSDQRKPLAELVTLSKFDLATTMVIEFTELQGYVGEQYALKWGIDPAIASGIANHYKPAFAGDSLPLSLLARVASVADKLETIVGHFAIGHIPSGSFDPYALRRQANGVVQIMLETPELTCNLSLLVDKALANLPLAETPAGIKEKLEEFLSGRLATTLRDRDIPAGVVNAILTLDLHFLLKRLATIRQIQDDPSFAKIVEAAVRVANITKAVDRVGIIDTTKFEQAIETTLWEITKSLDEAVMGAWSPVFIRSLVIAADTLALYFDAVMVMADDAAVRETRLGVLKTLDNIFRQIADFKAIEL